MEQARNPYLERPDISEVQIRWAEKSDPVMRHVLQRLDKLDQRFDKLEEGFALLVKEVGRDKTLGEKLKAWSKK